MSTERKGRSGGESGPASQPKEPRAERSGHARHRQGATLLIQLRRRYEAARRMPPLPHNGGRDPLTPRERADCRERP
jgi:hypothetical protein